MLQVWQNVLQLWEYSTEDVISRGRRSRQLVPIRRRFVDRSASSAVFVHFGFDKFGHLPYEVFVQSLTESPARLLGHELLLNKTLGGKNGIENLVDVAYLVGDAKVDYPKSTMVLPGSIVDGCLELYSDDSCIFCVPLVVLLLNDLREKSFDHSFCAGSVPPKRVQRKARKTKHEAAASTHVPGACIWLRRYEYLPLASAVVRVCLRGGRCCMF